ncbi:MAG TPA: FkbM family methyltransferase [Acidimicrobiales bacterium]|nr:FkbM family methyltransferase [Acidimicrobiales bacterium]
MHERLASVPTDPERAADLHVVDGFEDARRAGQRVAACQRQVTLAKQEYVRILRQLEAGGASMPDIRAALRKADDLVGVVSPVFHTNRWEVEQLSGHGFRPATVIDVGAATGTDALYEAFPDAYHVLIEPLAEFESDLAQLVSAQGGEYVLVAVGAQEGRRAFHVDGDMLEKSTFHVRTPELASDEAPEEREIPITTLDQLSAERGWKGPFGLKIDTKGFDDEVILGAPRLLEQTQFVITEVPITKRFADSSDFFGFVTLLHAHGFVLYDVLTMARTVDLRQMLYMDALFGKGR